MTLVDLLHDSCARHPGRTAVVGPDGALSYDELARLTHRAARALTSLGVGAGDRVAILAPKSTHIVALMQAVLRLRAAYVPLDPQSPPARVGAILEASRSAALIAPEAAADALVHAGFTLPPCLWLGPAQSESGICYDAMLGLSAAPLEIEPPRGDDVAYILHTSGSTGVPKGVCLTHDNARAFVDWAARTLDANHDDAFANHAPFHFDLSVLDVYAAFAVGARVVIVPESLSYAARELTTFVAAHAISIWYSVPSALSLMMRHGGLLELDLPALRAVLFAGEPFPIEPLRRLWRWRPHVRLLNLYGPTETNVCTFHEVTAIADDRIEPVPIGRACCGNEVVALDGHGVPVATSRIGELHVAGPTVMQGYWGEPRHVGAYATGDYVRVISDGCFQFVGRRDHMVKLRGFRVDLGEVEHVLAAHPRVDDVAVIAAGDGDRRQLIAFVVGEAPPSLVALKRHAATHLPRYMLLDAARQLDVLPRTATGKVDRRALAKLAAEGAR